MIATFLMASTLDVLYHHAKFGGEIEQRCRCENVVFVTFLFLTLRVRRAAR